MSAALVTGAGGGIGAAAARRLAEAGSWVAVADISEDAATRVATDICARGGRALAIAMDVTDEREVIRGFGRVLEATGVPPEFVVACAGVVAEHPFLDHPIDDWERIMRVNLTGTFTVLREAGRRLTSVGRPGSLVAVGSISGRGPRPTQAAYAASKAGVISLVRSAAVALAPAGIRVNAVCPGVVDTAMTTEIHRLRSGRSGLAPEASLAAMVATIPLGAMAAPEQIADVIAFLASPASSYVTGQAINVCGGLAFD